MDNSQNPNANNNGLNTTQNVSGIPNQSTLEQVSFNIGGVEVSAPTAAVQNPAPVAQPVQSAQPTQPSVQPSQPSVQPAQPAAQPVQPAVQPAQPAAQPAQPAVQPAQPAVQPAQPAVQPAQPVVQPAQPAAAVQSSTPVEQNVVQENVNTPISQPESPFFTPVSVQPEVQSSPVLPEPAPVVQPTQPVNPTPTVNQMEVQTNQQEVTNENSNGVEVIQTAPKSKASNVILIIFLVLLILFVLNIDTVISMYDQYKNAKTITNPVNKNTNNLTDGYILINENTSSIKLKDIKFYNFRKSQGKGITFSYEALAKYDNASSLEIYIEIYNSEKEILYKELFNPSQKIEKDTVRTYTLNVENDIFNDAFYALVKIYTDEEKQSKETLTCTLDDEHYQLKNIYIFENKGLLAYEISKTSKDENDESLQKEYEEMKETNSTASFENNTLTYKIELNADNSDTITLYAKDTTLKVIKDKETYKEWKCE